MLWRKKQADQRGTGAGDISAPAQITVPLDAKILGSKLEQMLEALDEQGGLDKFVDALRTKHELFARALDEQALAQMDRGALDALLETVFAARRRLPEALLKLPEPEIGGHVRELLYGGEPLVERMERFVAAVPVDAGAGDKPAQKAAAKTRRAAWDFAAEMLHFRDMEGYPLMCRWVWDMNTESGAMREFVTGGDTLRENPFDSRPETFEGFRVWMREQLAELGFYRDVPIFIDMLLGWSYADYMKAMSNRMGVLEAEFGGKQDPTEPMQKLLGIDPGRRHGQSRVKKQTVH